MNLMKSALHVLVVESSIFIPLDKSSEPPRKRRTLSCVDLIVWSVRLCDVCVWDYGMQCV